MKNLKRICFSLVATSLMTAPVAFAESNKKMEKSKSVESSKSTENLKQVEGTVINHKFVNVFKDQKEMQEAEKSGKASDNKMLVVMIKTAKGNDRLVVDLGQMKSVPEIKNGETKISVEGKLVTVGNEQLFVAKRAKLNGTSLSIERKST